MNDRVYLKKNEERRLKTGHLWVFSNEILETEGDPVNGSTIDIFDSRNNFLGAGFYNRNSLIAVRILSYEKINDLRELFQKRLSKSFSLRKSIYPERNSFRMIFSESDFLPGLIIDKYNNTYVMQVYSAGMEKNIGLITDILKDDYGAENIFTRNEEYFRKLEGLRFEDKIYFGEMRKEVINDGSVKFEIDFEKGHKTGFYFDQSDNRFFIERFVRNRTVLDGFCNSGGFGLHAAMAGASLVTFIDSSTGEIKNAENNFTINSLQTRAEFIVSDVFDYLEACINENKYFDIVMIDPPAFARNRKSVPAAKKGYEKLNRLALKVLNKNGILITSSCSHHISENDFLQIITHAAAKSGRHVQQIYFNGASLDHPRLPAMAETAYLKFGIFTAG